MNLHLSLFRVFKVLKICAGCHEQYTQDLCSIDYMIAGLKIDNMEIMKIPKQIYRQQFYKWFTVHIGVAWIDWIKGDKSKVLT